MRDNIGRGAAMALCVVVALITLGSIPEKSVAGVELRRINILSQLLGDEHNESPIMATLTLDESEFEVDLDAVANAAARVHEGVEVMAVNSTMQSGAPATATLHEQTHDTQDIQKTQETTHNTTQQSDHIALTPIEEFSSQMQPLYEKLSSCEQTTRIAILGDSFIEGDILTADLRESLQLQWGGAGVGFVPFPTSLSKYRRTIRTSGEGWQEYNIMQRRDAPEHLEHYWTLSGWCVEAQKSGAQVVWESTNVRESIDSCSCVRVLFVAREGAEISVRLDDNEPSIERFEPADELQQIICRGEAIRRIEVTLLSSPTGFIGYGAIFDNSSKEQGSGVVVDNYSIRSNNGQAILWCDPTLTSQLDRAIEGYDLIVLQYGLNLLQRGVSNYERYRVQIEKMIDFVSLCHPKAAVVVMGVSDRSIKSSGEYRPLTEAKDMEQYQRSAAESRGAAFWSTFDAMQQRGGMAKFVANRWAAKDYTHINAAGGREIAHAFVEALNVGAIRCLRQRFSEALAQREAMVSQERRVELRKVIIGEGSFRPMQLDLSR